MTANLRLWFW